MLDFLVPCPSNPALKPVHYIAVRHSWQQALCVTDVVCTCVMCYRLCSAVLVNVTAVKVWRFSLIWEEALIKQGICLFRVIGSISEHLRHQPFGQGLQGPSGSFFFPTVPTAWEVVSQGIKLCLHLSSHPSASGPSI